MLAPLPIVEASTYVHKIILFFLTVFPCLAEALKEVGLPLLRTFWLNHVNPILSGKGEDSVASATRYKVSLAFAVLEAVVDSYGQDASDLLTPNVVEAALSRLSRLESAAEEDADILRVLGKIADR